MPTFSGVVTDFNNKAQSFNFKVGGVKVTFKGNNIHGIKDGDGVTGAYKESPGMDKATGKTFTWNEGVEVYKSSTAAAQAPVQTPNPAAPPHMYGPLTSAPKQPYRAFGTSGGFPVAPDSYERCTLRRDCVRDAVASVAMLKTPLEPSAIIAIAKQFEAYVSGDADTKAAKSALEQLSSTDED